MEKQIKRLVQILQTEYWIFIIISILLSLSYEIGWLPEGIYAGDARLQYVWGTAGILVALTLVPLSLKLFNIVMNKKIKNSPLQAAIKLYRTWSEIRLLMLAIVTFFNIFVYYSTLDNIGGLCALIGITASVFCLPGEKKLKEELSITDNLEK